MLNKVAGLARALGLLLALVAAFVAIPAPVPLILVLLGLAGGLAYGPEDFIRLALAVVVLPVAGAALGTIPTVGTYLAAFFGNAALVIAGALATRLVLRSYELIVGDLKSLSA
jgi:hypothetical protein